MICCLLICVLRGACPHSRCEISRRSRTAPWALNRSGSCVDTGNAGPLCGCAVVPRSGLPRALRKECAGSVTPWATAGPPPFLSGMDSQCVYCCAVALRPCGSGVCQRCHMRGLSVATLGGVVALPHLLRGLHGTMLPTLPHRARTGQLEAKPHFGGHTGNSAYDRSPAFSNLGQHTHWANTCARASTGGRTSDWATSVKRPT